MRLHLRQLLWAINALCSTVSWLDAALGFFYSEVCQGCARERAGRADGYVCADCRATVEFIEPPFCERCGAVFPGEITSPFECGLCREMDLSFSHARAAVAASGVMLQIIHHYKYGRALWVEPFMAGLFTRIAAPALASAAWDLIVPVPLHPRREAERGFNQAERLAGHLAKATDIPVAPDLIRRVADTPTQTRLSKAQRRGNVATAFAPRSGRKLNAARVVLVDDVLTTGATADACARVLRRLGAVEVCTWTLARGLLH